VNSILSRDAAHLEVCLLRLLQHACLGAGIRLLAQQASQLGLKLGDGIGGCDLRIAMEQL
jgi:hypothetical protein